MQSAYRRRLFTFIAPPVLVVLCSLPALTLGQSAATDAPMTNEDVIKMAQLGFGDEVIDAKIQQATNVAFRLDVDDLSRLKAAGVSQRVISEMLKRSTSKNETTPAASPYPVVVGAGGLPPGLTDVGSVKLITKDRGEINLRSIGGSMGTTYAFVTVLMHINFPGLTADTRIHDHRPTLLIRSGSSPKGRLYLVSAEVDKKAGVRSVKMGNAHFMGVSNMGAPDSSNQIDYTAVAEGTDTWRIKPTKDLPPGEYGLWSSMLAMYDFGVDP